MSTLMFKERARTSGAGQAMVRNALYPEHEYQK